MDPNPIRRVARSGILVLGGGFAGVQVEARPDRIAIADAQLIVALGAFADSVPG